MEEVKDLSAEHNEERRLLFDSLQQTEKELVLYKEILKKVIE